MSELDLTPEGTVSEVRPPALWPWGLDSPLPLSDWGQLFPSASVQGRNGGSYAELHLSWRKAEPVEKHEP